MTIPNLLEAPQKHQELRDRLLALFRGGRRDLPAIESALAEVYVYACIGRLMLSGRFRRSVRPDRATLQAAVLREFGEALQAVMPIAMKSVQAADAACAEGEARP